MGKSLLQQRQRRAWHSVLSLCLLCLAAALLCRGVWAQRGEAYSDAVELRRFDIPPGSLLDALEHFARQAGVNLSYRGEWLQGLESQGLRGRYSAATGLAKLLAGTGLQVVSGAGGYAIERPQARATLQTIKIHASAIASRTGAATAGVSAMKTPVPLANIPASVSVVSRAQMTARADQSVAQALRYSAGMFSEYRGSSNLHDETFLRGFFYTPRYLDGLSYGGTSLGQVDPYLLEDIVLLRGPVSVLYGQAKPGGIINMLSKQPSGETAGSARLVVGNRRHRSLGVDLQGNLDEGLAYRLVSLGESADEEVDAVTRRRRALLPSLSLALGDSGSILLTAFYQRDPEAGFRNFMERNGTVDATAYGRIPRDFFVGDPDFQQSSRRQVALGYALEQQASDAWVFRQKLRYADIETRYKTLVWNALGDDQENISRTASGGDEDLQQWLMDNQLQWQGESTLNPTFLLGLDYYRGRRDYRWGMNYTDVPDINWRSPHYGIGPITLTPTDNSHSRLEQVGLYLQGQVEIGSLSVVLSGRQDWAATRVKDHLAARNRRVHDSALSHRVGLVYQMDNGLSPYMSYSTSFEPVLEAAPSGQAPYQPSTARQWEAGLKYLSAEGRYALTGAAYDIEQRDVLFWNPDIADYSQTGEVRSRGVELESKLHLSRRFGVSLGYSYIDSDVLRASDPSLPGHMPARVPTQQASAWASYQWMFGLSLAMGVRRVGKSEGDGGNSFQVPAVTLVDMALEMDVGRAFAGLRGTTVQLNVSNLRDERYVASCASAYACFYGAGREILATLRYEW